MSSKSFQDITLQVIPVEQQAQQQQHLQRLLALRQRQSESQQHHQWLFPDLARGPVPVQKKVSLRSQMMILRKIDNAISAQRLNSNSSPSRPVEKKVCIVSHLSYLRWLCALCDYSRFGCVDSPFYGNLRNCRNKLSAAEKMCF